MAKRFLSAVLAVGLAACGSTPQSNVPDALTEYDFAADPTLALQPGQVGVTFLEAMDATSSDLADTGTMGVDTIPFVVIDAGPQTYELDPADDSGTIAKVELKDPSGAVLHTLTTGAPSLTMDFTPGIYTLVIYSGYAAVEEPSGSPRILFLQPSQEGAPSRAAMVQAPAIPLRKFFSSKTCKVCRMSGVYLAYVDMNGMNLWGTNFTGANMKWSSLIGADLRATDLDYADLSYADLTRANMYNAGLKGAKFTGARWTDGTKICAEGSIGVCK